MATTPTIKMTTALTCPTCGQVTPETMPADCCMFCSLGTVPCPPVQAGTPCC